MLGGKLLKIDEDGYDFNFLKNKAVFCPCTLVLYPLFVSAAVCTLIYNSHSKSWLKWTCQALAEAVRSCRAHRMTGVLTFSVYVGESQILLLCIVLCDLNVQMLLWLLVLNCECTVCYQRLIAEK